jgi:hypothetical protein
VRHSLGEDFLRSPEVVAGIEQVVDFLTLPRPLLDLVEIAIVRLERVEGNLRLTSQRAWFQQGRLRPPFSFSVLKVHKCQRVNRYFAGQM